MTPAYKEALENKEKDTSLLNKSKKRDAKHLGYSLSAMGLWVFSILHTTIDFQLFLLVAMAVFFTYALWSWKLTVFTLALSIGFHFTEGTPHYVFMAVLSLTILITFFVSLGSISQGGGSRGGTHSDYDLFVDEDGDYGSGDSGSDGGVD